MQSVDCSYIAEGIKDTNATTTTKMRRSPAYSRKKGRSYEYKELKIR
jgi:hypothetical protein